MCVRVPARWLCPCISYCPAVRKYILTNSPIFFVQLEALERDADLPVRRRRGGVWAVPVLRPCPIRYHPVPGRRVLLLPLGSGYVLEACVLSFM